MPERNTVRLIQRNTSPLMEIVVFCFIHTYIYIKKERKKKLMMDKVEGNNSENALGGKSQHGGGPSPPQKRVSPAFFLHTRGQKPERKDVHLPPRLLRSHSVVTGAAGGEVLL